MLSLPFGRFPALVMAALVAAPALSQTALPVAPIRDVPETFFGSTVPDPYRDFENFKAPAVAAWMKAHSDHAHKTLRAIPGRDGLRAAIERYDSASTSRVAGVVRLPGELYFYEKRSAKEDQFKLYMRRGLAGAERLAFDPETLKKRTGKPHAVNYFKPSPDGRFVALGVSAEGSEEARLRVIETSAMRQVGREISRADFGSVSWAPDSSELWFNRLQALTPGMAETEKYQASSVVALRPGDGETKLRTVLRAGDPASERAPAIPRSEAPFLDVQPDGRVFLIVADGVSSEFRAWASTLDAVRAGRAHWRPLFDKADGVTAMAVQGDQLYALSFKGAPRYKLLAGPVDGFDITKARTLLPESSRVLSGIAAASDALYVEAREGNVKKLMRLSYTGGAPVTDVKLPVDGAFSIAGGQWHPQLPGLLLDLQGWTRARQIYAVAADGTVSNTGLQPASTYDAPADVMATEVMVKSHDGALVPMSIVHKRGVKLDGSNPVLLYGYASYGYTEEPWFSVSRLAFMDAGGVFAVANPRGSGVFGREWHLAGKQATKPNSWRDFIACAEWLITHGWTKPAHLAINGGSAGGILVGMAMVERPDLFAAVVPEVGALDMVRGELEPSGPPNIPEFGTRADEAGFRALLAMSTYHQIKDGVRYPAVLLTQGVNDPRVLVSNTTKTAARLMAASTSGKPVLMRLDYAAGHGIGSTKSQAFDERADVFAFVLWQTGAAAFQPRP
jgi:prolyl oligopeptidase